MYDLTVSSRTAQHPLSTLAAPLQLLASCQNKPLPVCPQKNAYCDPWLTFPCFYHHSHNTLCASPRALPPCPRTRSQHSDRPLRPQIRQLTSACAVLSTSLCQTVSHHQNTSLRCATLFFLSARSSSSVCRRTPRQCLQKPASAISLHPHRGSTTLASSQRNSGSEGAIAPTTLCALFNRLLFPAPPPWPITTHPWDA